MQDFGEDEETERDPSGARPGSRFIDRGYTLSPPFAQIVVGQSTHFWLTVQREKFPELEVGSTVQIQCLSKDIAADRGYCGLELHPTREGLLCTTWKIKGINPTDATGIRVRVGSIDEESAIEVLASEADKYRDVTSLQFNRKRYRMRTDQKRKRIVLFAPTNLAPSSTAFNIDVPSKHFELVGQRVLQPHPELGVAICELRIKCDGKEASCTVTATLGSETAKADLSSHVPMAAGLSITIEDVDLENQRYRWRQNTLELAGRHPSLKRYLGNKDYSGPQNLDQAIS